MGSNRTDRLLQELAAKGCKIETDGNSVLVLLPDGSTSFLFEQIGAWVHLGSTLVSAEDLTNSAHVAELARLLLRVQHRCLGCRFSFEDAGFLAIGADVYPDHHDADHVLRVMEQADFVGNVVLPLCQRMLRTGEAPSETEIDEAFEQGNL